MFSFVGWLVLLTQKKVNRFIHYRYLVMNNYAEKESSVTSSMNFILMQSFDLSCLKE